MREFEQPNESFLLPAINPAWSGTVKALLVAGAIIFTVRYFNLLWSGSIDLAHHYALVSFIEREFRAPLNSSYLAEMNGYPHYSHALAAIFGSFFSSPLMGIQLVTLLSIYSLWTALAVSLVTLPQRKLSIFILAFVALLTLNRFFLHAELFGNEVISNFFFSELVAQALCAWVYAIMLLMERQGTPKLLRYAFCVIALHVSVGVHLLATVELFGSLGLLVTLDVIKEARPLRLRAAFQGAVALLAGCAAIVLDPAFEAMRRLSVNNGALLLQLVPNLRILALLTILVIILSLALVSRWFFADRMDHGRQLLAYKYFACFGMATGFLCLLQMALLNWGLGSEYACRKYAFALQSIALINLALLACSFTKHPSLSATQTRSTSLRSAVVNFSPVLLVLFGLLLAFSPPENLQAQNVGQLVSIERTLTSMQAAGVETDPGKQSYVVGLSGLPWVDDYLFSIGIFRAPIDDSTRKFIFGKSIQSPEKIGRIITNVDTKPWDIPACREHVYAGAFVVLDGACAIPKYQSTSCKDGFDFSESGYLPLGAAVGFSGPEASGRWNDGMESSITCTINPAAPLPTRVLIYAQGHLPAGPQHMLVSVNGGPYQTFLYSQQSPLPVISFGIPKVDAGQLNLRFRFPDGKKAGTNDPRVISVFFHKIRFE
ncbi:MAG: hypothetical protein WC617_10775 [Rhodanobacter sp.]|jgi:hypothetical protein